MYPPIPRNKLLTFRVAPHSGQGQSKSVHQQLAIETEIVPSQSVSPAAISAATEISTSRHGVFRIDSLFVHVSTSAHSRKNFLRRYEPQMTASEALAGLRVKTASCRALDSRPWPFQWSRRDGDIAVTVEVIKSPERYSEVRSIGTVYSRHFAQRVSLYSTAS